MYAPLSTDTLAVRDLARDFAKQDVGPAAAAWDADAALPARPVEALGALGVLGLAVPEAAGGAGLGALELVVVAEELAAKSGVLAHHVAVLAGQLALWSDAAPAHPDLARALAGSLRVGGGLQGAPALTLDASGRVHGVLDPVLGAQRAERALVNAIGADGVPRVVLCDPSAPGVTRTARSGELGLRGVDLGRWVFDGAAVEDLGPLRLRAAARASALERLALAGVALGLGRAALDDAARYAAERKQFGQAIAEFQAVSFKLADCATELDAARLLAHASAQAPSADADEDPELGAQLSLVLALKAAARATDEALQIHGGYGYTRDFPVERYWRDARALGALAGPVDALALDAGAALLDAGEVP